MLWLRSKTPYRKATQAYTIPLHCLLLATPDTPITESRSAHFNQDAQLATGTMYRVPNYENAPGRATYYPSVGRPIHPALHNSRVYQQNKELLTVPLLIFQQPTLASPFVPLAYLSHKHLPASHLSRKQVIHKHSQHLVPLLQQLSERLSALLPAHFAMGR